MAEEVTAAFAEPRRPVLALIGGAKVSTKLDMLRFMMGKVVLLAMTGGTGSMRIVLIGVSHWHTPFYLDPLLTMPDMSVVGVSDPDLSRAEEVAAKAHCPAFSDYREMCARLRPDFAFALGRHCDMADEARCLIAERIPFAMEKPCAITAADAHDIAARAAQARLFAPVPFWRIRYSKLINPSQGRRQRAGSPSRSNSSAAWWTATMNNASNGCCIARPPAAGRCSISAYTSLTSAACCCRTRRCMWPVRSCRTTLPGSTSRITPSC
jgi:hypothetical protein